MSMIWMMAGDVAASGFRRFVFKSTALIREMELKFFFFTSEISCTRRTTNRWIKPWMWSSRPRLKGICLSFRHLGDKRGNPNEPDAVLRNQVGESEASIQRLGRLPFEPQVGDVGKITHSPGASALCSLR